MFNEMEYRDTLTQMRAEDLHVLFSLNLRQAIRFDQESCPIAKQKVSLIETELRMREILNV